MNEENELRSPEQEGSPPRLEGGGVERRGDTPPQSDTPKPEQAAEGERIPPPPAEAPPFRQGGHEAAQDLRAHLAALYGQAEELAREDPGFDLAAALRDPDFLRLTSPAVGVSVRRAWYALHGAERERQAARRALDEAAEAVARSAARPREGGRGLAAGALSAADPRALGRSGREALRQRIYDAAARGEKIYP